MTNVSFTRNEIYNLLADLNDVVPHYAVSGATWEAAKKVWDSLTAEEQETFNEHYPNQHGNFKKRLEKK